MNAALVIIFTMVFVCIFMIKIDSLRATERQKDSELTAKEQQLEEESKRTEELEEQRVYVQTKKYIEEEAKKMGYVHTDEIIFKPEEKQ